MSDVAQILGVSSSASTAAGAAKPPPPQAAQQPSRAMKLQGMPREVMDLLSGKQQDSKTAELPPAVPASGFPGAVKGQSVKVGNKWISTQKPARRWVWAPFSSSSRTDGLLLHHWVRANVEYPDYPYARFDIHLDPVTFSDDEYRAYLQSDSWTKSETGHLLELAKRYELRWPVIHDRWVEAYGIEQQQDGPHHRKIEDLQHRYYSVAATLTQSRISQEAAAEVQALSSRVPDPSSEDPKRVAEALLMEQAAARALASSEPQHQPLVHNLGSGTSNKVFDLNYERERRAHMEALWNRTKEEELEEAELRKELKQVEAQLRKVKKAGGHILAATNSAAGGGTGTSSLISSAASSRNASRAGSPVHGIEPPASALLDQAFASTAPTPMPQTPYLQSGRLAPPATGGPAGLNKTLLARMDTLLKDMNVPSQPIATKRVCDLYDSVRKDALTLLILQKNVLQKEGLVQSKRLKLAKLGGSIRVVDEETLLGIAAQPPAASPAGSTTATGRAKGARSGKGKGAAAGGAAKPKSTAGKAKAPTAETVPIAANKTGVKEAPAGGKQAPAGGKQARKGSTKRKRKADSSKSPPLAAVAAGAVTGTKPPPIGSTAATGKAAESSTTRDVKQPPSKKRARKS